MKRFFAILTLAAALPGIIPATPPDGLSGPGWISGEAERVEPGWPTSFPPLPLSLPSATSAIPVAEGHLVELARGLGHDPLRIFNHVRDHIAYTPYFGALKGPLLTLQERSGNDFDQSALLVRLLELSGYSPVFGYGTQLIPLLSATRHDLPAWLGTAVSAQAVATQLANGGIPYSYSGSSFVVNRVWVEVEIEGQLHRLDPAFKRQVSLPGATAALSGVLNSLATNLLSAAGGEGNGSAIRSLNQAAIFAVLDSTTSNLLSLLRQSHHGASMDELLGDLRIIPESVSTLPLTPRFPTSYTGTWSQIPAAYEHLVSLQHGNMAPVTLKTTDIAGRRLAITYTPHTTTQSTPRMLLPLSQEPSAADLPVFHPVTNWTTSGVLMPQTNGLPSAIFTPPSTNGVAPLATDIDAGAVDFLRVSPLSGSTTWNGVFSIRDALPSASGNWKYHVQLENSASAYMLSGGGSFSLPATAALNFSVNFSGYNQAPGTKTGKFVIYTAPANATTWTYAFIWSLTGIVAQSPDFDFSGYNSVMAYVGTPATESLALRNNGSLPLQLTAISRSGGTPARFSLLSGTGAGTLSAGSSRIITWRFDAAQRGVFQTWLNFGITYDGITYVPQNMVTLQGDARLEPNLAGSGGIDFGEQWYQTPVSADALLRNSGTLPLTISSITLGGSSAARFRIVSGGSSGNLAAGATRPIKVEYKADQLGNHTAYIRVAFDYDGLASSTDLPLKASSISGDLANIWLDDEPLVTESAPVSGPTTPLSVSIDHPYAAYNGTYADTTVAYTLKRGATYVVVHAFGGSETGVPLDLRRRQLQAYLDAGLDDTSREVKTEALNLVGQGWMEQTALADQIVNRLAGVRYVTHHRLGLVAQEEGCYVDVKAQFDAGGSVHGNLSTSTAAFKASGLIQSALEHAIIEQAQGPGSLAASTVRLIELANAQGTWLHLANSDNFATVVNSLSGYPQAEITALADFVANDGQLLLPQNGNLTLGEWSGRGYIGYGREGETSRVIQMIIAGDYGQQHGGYAAYMGELNQINVTQTACLQILDEGHRADSLRADPVNLATGALIAERNDLTIGNPAGGGVRHLAFTRHYASSSRIDSGAFGYGWTHSYAMRAAAHTDYAPALGRRTPRDAAPQIVAAAATLALLHEAADAKEWATAALVALWATDQISHNAVSVHLGDRALSYIRMPDGTFEPPPGVTATLSQTPQGDYTLTERSGTEYRFNPNGTLGTIADIDGNNLTLAYNAQTNLVAISDSYGRALSLDYTDGLLSCLSDDTGRTVDYSYSSAGDLASVTDPEGYVWRYSYDSAHRLLAITNPAGCVTVTNAYDSLDRVKQQWNGFGNLWQFYYSDFETREVDPAGAVSCWHYDERRREIARTDGLGQRRDVWHDGQDRIIADLDAKNNLTTYSYDANHNLLQRTDALGHIWHYSYDTSNRLVAATTPLGHTTSHSYSGAARVPTTITDPLGHTTTFSYAETGPHKGLPIAVTDPHGQTTLTTYDTWGNPATITAPDDGTTLNLWSQRGDLIAATDPLGHQQTFTYDQRRLRLTATDPLGQVTSNSYNSAGLPIKQRDPLGRTTQTTYTPTYNIAKVTLPDSSTIETLYDLADRVAATINPRGGISSNHYDLAGRLVAETDPMGYRTTMVLDPNGNPMIVTNALGYRLVSNFDALNRPILTTDPLGHRHATTYDNDGRITATTDPRNRTRHYSYDALDRRTAAVKPSGATDHFGHDALGNWTTYTNAEGRVFSMAYDAQNRPLTATNALGQQLFQNSYDPAGNLTNHVDGACNSISYRYDELNRLIERDGFNHEKHEKHESFEYDAVGNLLSASNATARLAFTYDVMDRIATATTSLSNATYTAAYAYDAGGMVTNMVFGRAGSPSPPQVARSYDADGRLVKVSDWLGHTWSFVWDGVGKPTGSTSPGGITATNHYDAAGQLSAWQIGNLAGRAITRDAVGLKTREDITAGTLPASQKVRYADNTFDAADRLISASVRYDSHINTATTETYLYDNNGALTNLVSGSNTAFSASYNSLSQLASLQTDHWSLATNHFQYDALGNRLVASSVVWLPDYADPLKRPLIEADAATGAPIRYYLWAPGRLLGFIDAQTETLTVAHCDEYGSVIALTDTSGNTRFTAHYGPSGQDWGSTGHNPTPFAWLGGHGVQQIADSEHLGPLYLTRYRLYAASLNRFLSSDPLGLAGGLNLYAYALGNPLAYIDPLGLCPESVWGAAASGFLEGLGGGFSILVNTFTFGGTDKLGWTDSSAYEGSAYTASRITATAARESLITAATLGIGTAARGGGAAAQTAYKGILVAEAATGGYQVGAGAQQIYDGNYESGALNIVAGSLRVGGSIVNARAIAQGSATWTYGDHKSEQKFQSQMQKRGWTPQQIDEAITSGNRVSAPNQVNPGNTATRYIHPTTGRSVVVDNITHEVLHVGGDGFRY